MKKEIRVKEVRIVECVNIMRGKHIYKCDVKLSDNRMLTGIDFNYSYFKNKKIVSVPTSINKVESWLNNTVEGLDYATKQMKLKYLI